MKHRAASAALAALILGTGLTFGTTSPASAATPFVLVGRASLTSATAEPTYGGDSSGSSVSADGRYVAFQTEARLVPEDTDAIQDVYLKDRLTDRVERISVTTDGSPASDRSFLPAVTRDGRYVAFWSWANDLVPGDTKNKADVFVRDLAMGTTERVSVSSSEAEGNGASPAALDETVDISDDGRYVTFTSSSTNFGADANTLSDVFVRDRTAGTTQLVSVSSAEAVGNSNSFEPSMSADGRYIAFSSDASNIVAPDANSGRDVYRRDVTGGTTIRVSLTDADAQLASGQSFHPSITDAGLSVAFTSTAKLVAADANTSSDVYVRLIDTGNTYAASVDSGNKPTGFSSRPAIAGSGGSVAFVSSATNLASGANGYDQIYLYANTVSRVSTSRTGVTAIGDSANPMLDGTGNTLVYDSKANNLTPGDTGHTDSFFRARQGVATYTDEAGLIAGVGPKFGASATAQAKALAAIRAGSSIEHQILLLARAPGFAGKRPPVVRLYSAYFLRVPDQSGLTYWTNKYANGTSLNKISASFAASSEFTTKYGSKTNSQFVTLIYQNIFARNPDPTGLAYWTKKLDGGLSRGAVMTAFSESSEGQRKLQGFVDLTLLSQGFLGTMPSSTMANGLLSALDQANASEGMVTYFIAD